jgi:hypothetical protein
MVNGAGLGEPGAVNGDRHNKHGFHPYVQDRGHIWELMVKKNIDWINTNNRLTVKKILSRWFDFIG